MSVETLTKSPFEATSRSRETQIDTLNWDFAQLDPETSLTTRITMAHRIFAGRLVLASSFGPTASILLTEVADAAPEVPVVNIRHGYETERTLELADQYQAELGFDLWVSEAEHEDESIPSEGTPEFKEFQHRTKVKPFQEMLDELRPLAYLSGRMRWQSTERAELPFVEDKGGVIAVNPIADLSFEAATDYIERVSLSSGNDYFDPAKGHAQKLECGLNTAIYT